MLTLTNLTNTLDFDEIEKRLRFSLDGKLKDDVVIIVIEHDKMLDRLSNDDYELQALMYKTGADHVYSFLIRSRSYDLDTIVFHESIHLLQYESGKLNIDPITGWAKWNGELYDAKTPYRVRPWEKEAFKGQDELMHEWKKANKQ